MDTSEWIGAAGGKWVNAASSRAVNLEKEKKNPNKCLSLPRGNELETDALNGVNWHRLQLSFDWAPVPIIQRLGDWCVLWPSWAVSGRCWSALNWREGSIRVLLSNCRAIRVWEASESPGGETSSSFSLLVLWLDFCFYLFIYFFLICCCCFVKSIWRLGSARRPQMALPLPRAPRAVGLWMVPHGSGADDWLSIICRQPCQMISGNAVSQVYSRCKQDVDLETISTDCKQWLDNIDFLNTRMNCYIFVCLFVSICSWMARASSIHHCNVPWTPTATLPPLAAAEVIRPVPVRRRRRCCWCVHEPSPANCRMTSAGGGRVLPLRPEASKSATRRWHLLPLPEAEEEAVEAPVVAVAVAASGATAAAAAEAPAPAAPLVMAE